MKQISEHSHTNRTSKSSPNDRVSFGRRIRSLRTKRNLTLADLAHKSGISVATLSKAERGLVALTYDRLTQLASGFNVDLPALFGDSIETFLSGSLEVARIGQFQLQKTPAYSYEILFNDVSGRTMVPMTGTVKAQSRLEFDDYIRHEGQEFLFVLSGKMTVHTENHPPVSLSPGESVYLDSGMGHVYTSDGEDEARVLVVCMGAAPMDPKSSP